MGLAHSLITAPDAAPSSWTLFLHGILGRGVNLRTLARRFVSARPERGAVLVDLRMHGDSQDLSPPHTVAAAAGDLVALGDALDLPVRGVVGHSFGGKVALVYLGLRSASLEAAWILDAMPGPRTGYSGEPEDRAIPALLDLLASTPGGLTSREDFVARLVAAGVDRGIAGWLAMNLVPRRGGEELRYALAIDLGAIRALLEDYFALDLWPLVEDPPGRAGLHFVIGERSPVYRPLERARLDRAAAASNGRITVETVAAGHFIHIDAPEAVLATLLR